MTRRPEVLEFIASQIQSNIRELEGALIRVTAFASLNQQDGRHDAGRDRAQGPGRRVRRARRSPPPRSWPSTAEYFGVTIDDLTGSSRSRVLVTARQIAMYLCRELTDLSLPKIGQTFGGRDHTTVMHAERKIRDADGRAAQRLQPDHRADQPDPDPCPLLNRTLLRARSRRSPAEPAPRSW